MRPRHAERANVGRVRSSAPDRGGEENGDGEPPHGAGVYASSGDVDKDGEVVGRLRPAIADELAVDAEEHLAAVLRMLAAAAALKAAATAPAGWSL